MSKQKAKISNCPEKCMKGVELRRLRIGAGLSLAGLATKMSKWGWDVKKVSRLQAKLIIRLDPLEMADLLTALDAMSI